MKKFTEEKTKKMQEASQTLLSFPSEDVLDKFVKEEETIKETYEKQPFKDTTFDTEIVNFSKLVKANCLVREVGKKADLKVWEKHHSFVKE